MKRDISLLLLAQFLTAFADNAILFTAIAMVLRSGDTSGWYVPTLQASFLVAFVLLAPWVGPFSDRHPKTQVLMHANWIKAAGAGLMLTGLDPLLSYAVVGMGAAMYSPAKYGILPELVERSALVRANGWVEGSTIIAIITGSLAGGALADQSVPAALTMVLILFLLSSLSAGFIRSTPVHSGDRHPALPHFTAVLGRLLNDRRARFTLLSLSLFWGAAVVLRVLVVAWAPLVLLLDKSADIAGLILYSAIGIAIGSLLAARLIPLQRLYRAPLAACAMGLFILLLAFVDTIWPARLVLLLTGLAGGIFVVPVNAALQEIGQRTVGPGNAVAVQHFFENLAMLGTTGTYAAATLLGATPVPSITVLGLAVIGTTVMVSRHLPGGREPE
jgi:LPLT family lysophospholipid transporter-like MFS transporter